MFVLLFINSSINLFFYLESQTTGIVLYHWYLTPPVVAKTPHSGCECLVHCLALKRGEQLTGIKGVNSEFIHLPETFVLIVFINSSSSNVCLLLLRCKKKVREV